MLKKAPILNSVRITCLETINVWINEPTQSLHYEMMTKSELQKMARLLQTRTAQ